MNCPDCNFEDTKVVDSRVVDEGTTVRRRRECISCGYRFTTYERFDKRQFAVIKRDKSPEPYDREKLKRGILIATAKRDVSIAAIDELIDDIEREIRISNTSQVVSTELGDMVLSRIKDIDEIAYIRFASVYKDFKSIDEFADAIRSME